MSEKLEPCPFCGVPPKVYTTPTGAGVCRCENMRCPARPEITAIGFRKGDDRRDNHTVRAIKQWNRRQERTCVWTYQSEPEYCWDTQCGEKHQFTEGGPKENYARFCCYCGGSLELREKEQISLSMYATFQEYEAAKRAQEDQS